MVQDGKLLVDPDEIRNGNFPPDSYRAKLQAAIGTHENPGPVVVEPDGTLRMRTSVPHDFVTDTHTGEYSRQVHMQERQVRDMTYQELEDNGAARGAWEDHREEIKEQNEHLATGQTKQPVPAEYGAPETRAYRKEVLEARAQEIKQQAQALGERLSIRQARAMARDEYSNLAALHGPDRIVGGYKDLFTGFGDRPINSALGAHWRSEWEGFDRVLREALSDAGIPRDLWGDIKLNVRFTVNGRVW